MDQVNAIMDFEAGELGANETLELFSDLAASGLVWQLQGCYGRNFMALVENGYLDKKGKILKRL